MKFSNLELRIFKKRERRQGDGIAEVTIPCERELATTVCGEGFTRIHDTCWYIPVTMYILIYDGCLL